MNPKLKIVIPIVVLFIVLAGAYLAGNSILSNSIKSNYQNKNCEQVLSLGQTYASFYPASIADKSIPDLTKECALYSLAIEAEQKKNWQDVYNAYQSYNQSYPKSVFAEDVNEHSALILTNQAREQLANKKYKEAIENIKLVLADFGKTKASATSANLMADVYTAWAKDQRDANDFAKAEETLKTFSTWAQSAKETEAVKSAQIALAQTYLGWGLSLQAKQQFEDARQKMELATSTDPQPEAGPGTQAKAAQAKLYSDWGDALLAQNDVPAAIAHYQTAITLSSEKDQPAIQDQIAVAHLKLAEGLNGKEDFLGALKEIEQAKTIATGDAAKTKIETAQTATYQAFSQSSGEQTQQAIADAAEKICSNKQPELPIFGLDANSIRAYLFPKGEGTLTDKVAANTPASLHYVACATPSTKGETLKTSRSKRMPGGWWQPIAGSNIVVERVTNFQDIKLYDLKTGKIVASQLFAGKAPISWADIWAYIDANGVSDDITFDGPEPSLEVISAWVAKYMK